MEAIEFLMNIGWPATLYFGAGLALLIIEMFHPGFGVPGIIGFILLIVGIVSTAQTFLEALVMIVILIALLGIALSVALRSVRRGRLSRIMVLRDTTNRDSGYIATEDFGAFLGREGVTLTVLRPAGTVDFAGEKLDVVSEGEFLPKGTKVAVVKVEGRRIVVREPK
jgi:membrane-bound ClpP family serine protease